MLNTATTATSTWAATRVIDPTADARWEAFVDAHPRATVFHTPAWLRVLRAAYGYEARAVVLEDSTGAIVAGVPFCRIESRLTGNRVVSLPFCDYVPPLASHAEHVNALLSELRGVAEEGRRTRYTQLRWGVQSGAEELAAWNATTEYTNYVVDLSAPVEEWERRLHSSARRGIRKSEREGLTVRTETDLDAVRSFYEMNVLTRRKHGIFPQPWRFFQELHRELIAPGRGFLSMVYLNGRPVAADFILCSHGTAFYKYNASVPSALPLRPNNLAIWHALHESRRRGATTFDLGRVEAHNEGLRRFKLLWGAQESPLPYYHYPAEGPVAGGEQGLAYRLAAPVLRRAPAPLLRLLGRHAYRHLG